MPTDTSRFDIAVIGAGISGLGVAEQAAFHGLSVLVLEQGVCGAATSANSLRIMHGGIRYLQTFDISRAKSSAVAQRELLSDFPDLMRPLRCVMPLQRTGLKSRWPMRAGGMLYALLTNGGARWAPTPRVCDVDRLIESDPALAEICPAGAFEWHDVQLGDPATLHHRLRSSLVSQGVMIRERTRVLDVRREDRQFVLKTEADELSARVVVDARGPWCRRPRFSLGVRGPAVQWCKAFNVVLARALAPTVAVGIQAVEKRLYFLVPRTGGSALGTGYVPFDGEPSDVTVSKAEIEDFLSQWNEAVPPFKIAASDVLNVEVGVLPCEGIEDGVPRLMGQEQLIDSAGYVEVLSTKYTTFRPQARKVLDLVRPYLKP